jgi:thioredoxin-disulfide reductase
MYDTTIIGAGPAGLTSAIYAARREMKTLVIGKDLGGQLVWANEIENYPGFMSIKAIDLVMKIQEQVKNLGVEIKHLEVKKIEKNKDGSFILYSGGEKIETKTIIIAMGLIPRRLSIPGEREFNGKGISYCAKCDGPFYRDKDIVVVGGGNSALDAAEVLSKIGKKVYLVHRSEEFRAFEALVNEVKEKENIEMILNSSLTEIVGDERVKKVKVVNNKTGEEREIEAGGVFIEIGRIAHTDLLENIVDRDKNNQILVDKNMKTSVEGIFAAGDVTQVEFKQIPIAMGQATIAALSAYQYLQLKHGGSSVVSPDIGKIKS